MSREIISELKTKKNLYSALFLMFGILTGIVIQSQIPIIPLEENECPLPTYSGINLQIDTNFNVSLWNDTSKSFKYYENNSYEVLFAIISVQMFDPIIIDAYNRNKTNGENLTDILGNKTNLYQCMSEYFISNGNIVMFMNNLYEIVNGTEPLPENMTDLLLPLSRSPKTLLLDKPFFIAGITLFCIAKEKTNLKLFSEDIILFTTGFIKNTTLFNINIEDIIESQYFVNTNEIVNLRINNICMNMTKDFWYSKNYTMNYKNSLIKSEYSPIPTNPFSVIVTLSTILNGI
jgi:hypothetical protein